MDLATGTVSVSSDSLYLVHMVKRHTGNETASWGVPYNPFSASELTIIVNLEA